LHPFNAVISGFLLPLPFLLFGASSFYLFIYIAISTFSGLSLIGRAAVIFVFLIRLIIMFLSLVLYNDALCLVAAAVYTFVKSNVDGLSTLDHAFIVFAAIGHTGVTIMYLVSKYVVGPRLYEEWLDSFGPDWPYKVVTADLKWIRRFNRLSSFICRLGGLDD
jgi:hypothetical protein